MTAPTRAPAVQRCRRCGGEAPHEAHFCPRCSTILALAPHQDYFAFLGLPRKLTLDRVELDERFRSLSRQFHPDYYCNATPAERRASLERASYLNDAYRTLRHLPSRIEYLLELETPEGRTPIRARGEPAVPPALLEEVFALNEELDAIRELRAAGRPAADWRGRLERARAPIEARRDAHAAQLQELSARWDALVDHNGAAGALRDEILAALSERMLERNYIGNLLAAIERELAPETL
jgi:molecular chaperone HscB